MATSTADAALSPSALAERLVVAFRTGADPDPFLSVLADLEDGALAPLRRERERALAFWLNCYNAGTQRLLDRRPELYAGRLRALRFFRAPALTVAGTALSLDDIEQGILRGRSKYGLGYLPRLLPTRFELRHRVELDPRIHFALNCGAASCPAIRPYDPARVDDQLDLATRGYLDSTVTFDPVAGLVRLPRVFLWYRGDFGGRRGTLAFLERHGAVPEGVAPRVRYRPWDWSRAERNFAD